MRRPKQSLGRNKRFHFYFVMILIAAIIITIIWANQDRAVNIHTQTAIKLPDPILSSNTSIEEALKFRRSIREYKNEPLTINQVSQLLWSAQGITSPNGFRTAPSAGGLYPLQIFVVCNHVTGLQSGFYQFSPESHSLILLSTDNLAPSLAAGAFDQNSIKSAAIDIIITALYSRTIKKYGDRGIRFAILEAGHSAENIYLQAVSLKLGTVAIGGFDDAAIKKSLGLSDEYEPLYIMPVGKI